MPLRLLLILIPVLFLSACSGVSPRPDTTPSFPTPSEGSYETFDPTTYSAEPVIETEIEEIEHDVPDMLMDGRIVEAIPEPDEPEGHVTVQGFRIQLFSSDNKPAADRVYEDAVRWWSVRSGSPEASEAFEFGFQPAVVYSRPYYRVRIGAFRSRSEAESALEIIRAQYSEAFIVPDSITFTGN